MDPITLRAFPYPGQRTTARVHVPIPERRADWRLARVRLRGKLRAWTADAWAVVDASGSVVRHVPAPAAVGALVTVEQETRPGFPQWARVVSVGAPALAAAGVPVLTWPVTVEAPIGDAVSAAAAELPMPWAR